jgi:hypothetical protein
VVISGTAKMLVALPAAGAASEELPGALTLTMPATSDVTEEVTVAILTFAADTGGLCVSKVVCVARDVEVVVSSP